MEFKVVRNDITNMYVDAIVLPANPRLREGSGTSKAIFTKAGEKELREACRRYTAGNRRVAVGTAVATFGLETNANYILHAVVPKWRNGKHREHELLSLAYLSALRLADDMNCESIAFPLLSSGNNRFDKKVAWLIAKRSIEQYTPQKKLKKSFLVIYDENTTTKLKMIGVDIEEFIDASYTIDKDDRYMGPLEKTMWGFVDKGNEMGEDFLNKFEDPDELKKMISFGSEILMAMAKKIVKEIMSNK